MLSIPSILFPVLLILTGTAVIPAAAPAPAPAPAQFSVSTDTLLPNCRRRCGNLTIPYPFGIEAGCYREFFQFQGGADFQVTCNDAYDPPKAFITAGDSLEVLDISILQGEVTVRENLTAYSCYNGSGQTSSKPILVDLTGAPSYAFSDTRNKFTAIGCKTLWYLNNEESGHIYGCQTSCNGLTNGSCTTGSGCCQTSAPGGLRTFSIWFDTSYGNYTDVCIYAFLASQDAYEFNSTDLRDDNLLRRQDAGLPVVLDWAIVTNDGESCDEAKLNKSTYACLANNSVCYNSTNPLGYRCNCSKGYEGNPYIVDGCQDVDECKSPQEFPCYGICTNTPGDFSCLCKPGTNGDAKKVDGCVANTNQFPLSLKLVIGLGSGIFFLVIVGTWIYLGMEKRKLIRAKREFFKQNGGVVLQQQINSQGAAGFKIFTKEELEKATNEFDESRILGRGGFGTVYKGILDDNRVVAVKRSKIMDENQTKEFAREMVILSQINHKNIVKILGCCLEVEVPMLVYEFIHNGTLFHYLHGKKRQTPISLDARLRIAAESADALAYLHSSASPPIVHADVKSSNILLDDTYTAKVSDFGASKLAPNDENQLATLVQGTWGYLDPEYLQTCQLTVKSDVYSFGVVLLELLTGKKALYIEGSEEEKGLAAIFISAFKGNRVQDIMDSQILNEEDMELLKEVAALAMRCLNARGEERPTMKEVADELGKLRRYKRHPWVQGNKEEVQTLLNETANLLDIATLESNTTDSVVAYSLEERALLHIERGR